MSLSEHIKNVSGARRRNNIFGEVSDYVVSAFLAKGGDGAIYNPSESDEHPVTLYARSESELYFIKVMYQESRDEPLSVLNQEQRDKLLYMSAQCGARPCTAVARGYSKCAKFYDLSGRKITSFK